MKKKFKWFAIAALLIMAIFCIEINISNCRYSSVNEDILDVVNSATLSILLILAIRFTYKKSNTKIKDW